MIHKPGHFYHITFPPKADKLNADQVLEPLRKRCLARNAVCRARNDFKKRMISGKEKPKTLKTTAIIPPGTILIPKRIQKSTLFIYP